MRLGLTPVRRPAVFVTLAVALASVAVLRISATYTIFSNTYDEPNHLVAGMEWLERGTFRFEPKHPPLGRIAIALGPYIAGVRLQDQPDLRVASSEILYSRGTYLRDLTLARLGILPFFLSATVCVWLWGRRLYGAGGAALAVALFTTTPVVLGHAGVATTDMPLTGTLIWALVAFSAWLDDKSVTNGVLVGATAATAVLSKMSAMMFLPAAVSALVIARWLFYRREPVAPFVRPSRRAELSLVAAATTALVLVWALYRFSVGRRMHSIIPGGVPLLAPEFFDGFVALALHNARGHPAFLLGEYGTTGWWYFFPVALALKTPIPMLVLTGVGIAAAVLTARRRATWTLAAPGLAALAILAVSMRARINIGVRHVLPLVPLLAIAAAYGTVWLWNQNRGRRGVRAMVAGLLGWQFVSSARADPDYLPYFNEFAGRHPDRLLLDSDLDWGQDLIRLADTLRVRRIDSVSVAYFGTADVAQALGAHARRLRPNEHASGWVAASAQYLLHPSPDLDGYKWINAYEPVTQVGKSIRLFFVPPPAR